MPEQEQEVTFKTLFIPLTTSKAVHIIVILGLLVFCNMLFNNFVWDDKTYIIYNLDEHTINFLFLMGKNLFNAGTQYRPVPAIYFASLYSLFQDSPFFYHVFQLLIHFTNTILLFFIFKKLLSKEVSLLLSLIFLVHPMQVESVSYIASSDNPLFFLFGITALFLSMKDNLTYIKYAIIFFLLLLSVLTKETGFLFLVVILLYRFLFAKKELILFISGSLITTLVYCLIRFGIVGVYFDKGQNPAFIARLPLTERLINVPAVIYYYLKTIFLPVHLSIEQLWTIKTISFNSFYFPLIIDCLFVVFITILGAVLYKKTSLFRVYVFFTIWLLIGLGMHAQIFPLDMTVADRWFYFPLVAILGLIGLFYKAFSQSLRFKHIRTVALVITIAIISLLSIRTIVRNTNWFDEISLYSHDLQLSDNYDIENNLGNEYLSLNNYDEAIKHFKKSENMFTFPSNIYNLALAYEKKGDYRQAKKYYLQLIANKTTPPTPSDFIVISYEKLGLIMLFTDKNETTATFIKNALQKYPKSSSLWADLAVCEYRIHHQQEATDAAYHAQILNTNTTTTLLYQKILNKEQVDIQRSL